jgi:hypothetical protein
MSFKLPHLLYINTPIDEEVNASNHPACSLAPRVQCMFSVVVNVSLVSGNLSISPLSQVAHYIFKDPSAPTLPVPLLAPPHLMHARRDDVTSVVSLSPTPGTEDLTTFKKVILPASRCVIIYLTLISSRSAYI